jgi:hypothetical protein
VHYSNTLTSSLVRILLHVTEYMIFRVILHVNLHVMLHVILHDVLPSATFLLRPNLASWVASVGYVVGSWAPLPMHVIEDSPASGMIHRLVRFLLYYNNCPYTLSRLQQRQTLLRCLYRYSRRM